MSMEHSLHLLVVEETRNDAEALANVLRDAGFPSKLTFVENLDELELALEQQVPDLVLCAIELDSVPMTDMLTCLRDKDIDAPFIAISEKGDEISIVNAMQDGATDLCSYDQPQHLQLIVKREMDKAKIGMHAHNYEQKFYESEKRARMLMESSRDAITYIHEGMLVYANTPYLQMFGFDSLEDIEGTPILDMVAPEQHSEFKDFLRNFTNKGELEGQFNTVGQLPDGETFDAAMEFAGASIDGEPCTQIVIRNHSNDSQELELQLQYLSKQDALTDLYNRQYFMTEVEIAVTDATSGEHHSALVLILMDHYKEIKDEKGIGAIDMLISELASVVRDHTEEDDIVARFSDHTFAILRKDHDLDDVMARAEKLRESIETHITEIDTQSVTTTCSIGVSLVTDGSKSAQQVISQADLAYEVARSAGGNQIHLHNPVADEKVGQQRDSQMRDLIDEALEQDHFQLLYQPIVSLLGNDAEKYEVLTRMRSEDGELILPEMFMPVAYQTGQLVGIDRWIIRSAINALAEHRLEGFDTQFFIKIAGATLLDEDLPQYIKACFEEFDLQPEAVIFEIAERSASQHLKQAKTFIKSLQELNCKSALEHFGTSPNSFQLLKHLPVDYLKIDGSFIHNLATDTDNQAMVKSILETAKSMNKECIAEYVQDAHSLAVLWQSGVNYIQGNFLQEPSETLSYDFSGEVA